MLQNLTETLSDIERLSRRNADTTDRNDWENITAADFGPEHDFDVEDHGSIIIIDCYSNAALQWCYKFLPADCPRWGARGFAIERRFVGDIINGMRDDNLMSRYDYEEAMEENHALNFQGDFQ